MRQNLFILSLISIVFRIMADIESTIETNNYQLKNVQVITFKPTSEGMIIMIPRISYRIRFRLQKDKSNFLAAAKVFIYVDDKIKTYTLSEMPGTSIYQGELKNENGSFIIGYFYENQFIGIFQHLYSTYFIGPQNEYSFDEKDEHTIMYNVQDIELRPSYRDGKLMCEARRHEEYLKMKTYQENYHVDTKIQIYNFFNNNLRMRQTKICSLELVADHTYTEYMDFNQAKIVSEMLLYIKIADYIFRNTDFDEDGDKEDIAFNVQKITIFETKNDPGNIFGRETKDYKEFLQSLTKYHHPYCMLICFTHRDFWTPTQCAVSKVNKIGGICPGSKPLGKSNNVGFVTNIENKKIIPRFRIPLNLVHQLGHAFACRDDPEKNKFCSPGHVNPRHGNYIMHPNISYGAFKNNWHFSTCCKTTLKNFLKQSRIKTCLLRRELSNCGNGIVEEGELCDCDSSTENCTAVQKCCRINEYPSQCTLRNGMLCSPSKGQCCDDNCDIIEYDKRQPCFSNIECFNVTTFCDGISSFCSGLMQPDGTPCRQNSRTCHKGQCKSNVCLDHSMKPCQCKTRHSECHICCMNETHTCRTAKNLQLFPSKDEVYVKLPGSSCDNGYGICSRNGSCIRKTIWKMYSIWNYLTPLPFLLIIVIGISCFQSHQHERPSIEILMKKYPLRKKEGKPEMKRKVRKPKRKITKKHRLREKQENPEMKLKVKKKPKRKINKIKNNVLEPKVHFLNFTTFE
ncbi:disintegrin and metalloproteinase domain-containing protein 10-like isoform X2 [Centruroides sculpturatus]|uniref:disintegrin and metalloproteinase domain-containing protein 10-like isoform X2 n=1 Tax=Centruroides sculpturatus TaxID=218467 RepID=UPI000C6E0B2E|nr:disintegrin and metalloproteinase domain-containing protein 10-like isoform X2 [Centruroides sculpturatus]